MHPQMTNFSCFLLLSGSKHSFEEYPPRLRETCNYRKIDFMVSRISKHRTWSVSLRLSDWYNPKLLLIELAPIRTKENVINCKVFYRMKSSKRRLVNKI